MIFYYKQSAVGPFAFKTPFQYMWSDVQKPLCKSNDWLIKKKPKVIKFGIRDSHKAFTKVYDFLHSRGLECAVRVDMLQICVDML